MSRHITNEDVHEDFAKILAGLAEAFRTELTAAQIKVYAFGLGDMPIDAVRTAAWRHIKEGRFFPSVSELRGETPIEDAALIAWNALERAAEKIGAYQDLEVEDPRLAIAVSHTFGSWPAFCELEDGPALAMKRKEFMAQYKAARVSDRKPVRLAGWCSLLGETAATGWCGRLLRSGAIESVADPRLLASAPATKALVE
jgi:hypothetical protein